MKNKTNIIERINRYFYNIRLARRRRCPKQQEINRLRKVLYDIADSRPDEFMDIEETPELTNWICDACHKASVGMYKTK